MTHPENWFDDGSIVREFSEDEERMTLELYETLNAKTPFERFQWVQDLLKRPDTEIPYYIKGVAFVVHKEMIRDFPFLSS